MDRIHGPVAAAYQRDLEHVLSLRGQRGEKERLRIRMVMLPRFSLKTTLGVVAFCVWATTIEPNIRIVIGSRREGLAQASLGAIKRIMEGDKRYIDRFGKRKPDSAHFDMRLAWAASGIIVADRTEHWLRERTIEIVGVRNLDPGYHFDIGLWDDPHGDDSPTEIDETWNALQNYIPISEPWGVIAITMTVWNEWDVPQRVEREWSRILAEPVVNMPACDPEFTESWMPELYPIERLQEYRQTMGTYKASCQFALVRMSSETQKFPPTFYREVQHDRKDARMVIVGVDPAFMFVGNSDQKQRWERRSNSDHAIVVTGWLGGQNVHFYDAEADQWDEEVLLDKIIEKVILWRPDILAIEENAVRYFVHTGLEARFRKLDISKGQRRPRLETFSHQGKSKLERIRIMIDPYKRGELTFSPDITDKEKTQQQFWQYSTHATGQKLDIPDAAAYCYDAIRLRMPSDFMSMPSQHIRKLQALEDAYPGYFEAVKSGTTSRIPFLQEDGGRRGWQSV